MRCRSLAINWKREIERNNGIWIKPVRIARHKKKQQRNLNATLQQSPLPPIIVGKSVNNGNFSVLMKNVCISPQFKRLCFFCPWFRYECAHLWNFHSSISQLSFSSSSFSSSFISIVSWFGVGCEFFFIICIHVCRLPTIQNFGLITISVE